MSKKFEEKIETSKKILDKLISDDIDLDKSLKLYKDGMKSLQEAQDMLDTAKLEFENLSKQYEE